MLFHRFNVSLEQTQRYECATRLVSDGSHERTLAFPNVSRHANSFVATSDRMPGLRLPDQFQRELNLAGGRLRGIDEAGAWDALPGLIEHRQVVGGRGKIRAVQNVENLGAELGVETFRDPPDVVVLENGEVQL